jgi:hypothetical protein
MQHAHAAKAKEHRRNSSSAHEQIFLKVLSKFLSQVILQHVMHNLISCYFISVWSTVDIHDKGIAETSGCTKGI